MPANNLLLTKAIKARYPEGKSKGRYIKSLFDEYRLKHDPLHVSDDQISIPINNVVSLVTAAIEGHDGSDLRIQHKRCSFLKKLSDEDFIASKGLRFLESDLCFKTLYYYQKGIPSTPSIILKRHNVEFPQEYEEAYVSFTQEMSRRVICEVTAQTKDGIDALIALQKQKEQPAEEKGIEPDLLVSKKRHSAKGVRWADEVNPDEPVSKRYNTKGVHFLASNSADKSAQNKENNVQPIGNSSALKNE